MISNKEAITRATATYNAASDYFDAPALSFWSRFGQTTIDRLSLNSGDIVLDVCCGSGASAIPAAKYVGDTGSVLGVDLAEQLLNLARMKVKQQNLTNIKFRAGDFQDLGLPDASFDAIVCVFGIFFVPDMVAAVQELWRMVHPGGKLAITSWGKNVFEPANRVFWKSIETERPDLYMQYTPWERIGDAVSLKELLEAGGATQVEVFEETGTHELTCPEDWWTMVMGGGCRGTIEKLDSATKKRIEQTNLDFLRSEGINSLKVDVLYAIAHKKAGEVEL
jgi:ubiquinone/menaquinone biosynthesis C-methylase UbiE